MKLIGCGMLAIFANFAEEGGVGIERSGKLMRITLIKEFLVVFIPFHRLIVIEGIAAAYADIAETRIFIIVL